MQRCASLGVQASSVGDPELRHLIVAGRAQPEVRAHLIEPRCLSRRSVLLCEASKQSGDLRLGLLEEQHHALIEYRDEFVTYAQASKYICARQIETERVYSLSSATCSRGENRV